MHSFILPTKIIFGSGSLSKIREIVPSMGRRILLITGKKAMRSTGILSKIESFLSETKLVLFDKVDPEVSTDNVDEARQKAKKTKAQVVIGLGGGSVIDCAKAVAGLGNKTGKTKDYLLGERQILSPGIPFVAIPTTAGTGAEVTPNAVLVDKKAIIKRSLRSPFLFAKVAIVDPELTLSLPPRLTAYSGMDALSQAIESYVSKGANPITDILAIKAISLVGSSIIGVYQQGSNLVLRENMLYGSLLSGIALFNARMGVVHGIAHPIGAIYGLPHGLLCGLFLPYAMEFNLGIGSYKISPYTAGDGSEGVQAPLPRGDSPDNMSGRQRGGAPMDKKIPNRGYFKQGEEFSCKTMAKKYKDVAYALGLEVKDLNEKAASIKAIERIRSILKALNFPQSLKELGVKKKDFPRIIRDSLPSGSLKANPRKVTAQDVRQILNRCWEGG